MVEVIIVVLAAVGVFCPAIPRAIEAHDKVPVPVIVQAVFPPFELLSVTAFVTVSVTPVMVNVPTAVAPNVNALMVVAPVTVGWLVMAPVPISTTSPAPGGADGVPLTVVQLVAVAQAVDVPPVHRVVPAARRLF